MTRAPRQTSRINAVSAPAETATASRRWWIDLTLGSAVARMELPRFIAVRVYGVDVVPLDQLWTAAHLGVTADSASFDFVGDDGFHLVSRQPEGIEGRDLATGYVSVATRDLIWRPQPERPSFWHVKGVARIIALERRIAGPNSPGQLPT